MVMQGLLQSKPVINLKISRVTASCPIIIQIACLARALWVLHQRKEFYRLMSRKASTVFCKEKWQDYAKFLNFRYQTDIFPSLYFIVSIGVFRDQLAAQEYHLRSECLYRCNFLFPYTCKMKLMNAKIILL